MKMCDGCPYPLDGKGHGPGCQREHIADLVRERDGLEQNVSHYRQRAEAAEQAVSMLRTQLQIARVFVEGKALTPDESVLLSIAEVLRQTNHF